MPPTSKHTFSRSSSLSAFRMSLTRNTQLPWRNSAGDEEYAQFPQNYRFQIPEGCHWSDIRVVMTNVGQALQKAMRGIERANPETLYGIFGDASWSNRDRLPDSLLRDLIEHFSSITLGNTVAQADVLGQSYEYRFTDHSRERFLRRCNLHIALGSNTSLLWRGFGYALLSRDRCSQVLQDIGICRCDMNAHRLTRSPKV
jgi:hypothetical protein